MPTNTGGSDFFLRMARDFPSPEPTVVVGADGFIGSRLLQALRLHQPDAVGTARQAVPGLLGFDLERSSPESFPEVDAEWAVIAAAQPNVAHCQGNLEGTWRVNVDCTLALARELARRGMSVIWYSSDHVFDGTSGWYGDTAPCSPLTEYGAQKAEVERRLPEATGGRCLVLRLSKTYGLAVGDGSMVTDIAARLLAGERIRAATDQVFNPTWVGDVVRLTLELARQGNRGLLNICAPEAVSRYEISLRVAHSLSISPNLVEPITLADLGEDFPRPQNTSMVCSWLGEEGPGEFVTIEGAMTVLKERP